MRILVKFKDGNHMILPNRSHWNDKFGYISPVSFDVLNPFANVVVKVYLNNAHNKKGVFLYLEEE